jgi:thimet oligopeptidase
MMVRSTGSIVALALCLAVSADAQRVTQIPFTAGLSTPEAFRAAIEGRLGRARGLLDGMMAVRGPRTIDNTLRTYDDMWGVLNEAGGIASVFTSNHPDEQMRKLGEDLGRILSAFAAEVTLRPDLFEALQAVDLKGADASTRFMMERELRTFRLAGVDKPEATRKRITILRDQLTQAMDTFARNIRSERGRVVLKDATELEGLPADFIARHKPGASGTITLTTDAVDFRPVMTYAKSADLRRRMLVESYNVAPQNLEVLQQILRVRADLAKELGFPNWAAVDMAVRMAGTVDTASRFIDRVVEAAGPRAEREFKELEGRKRQELPGSAFEIWDRQYYSEQIRLASYNFDSQAVRPYLPFAQVLSGVLEVSSTIFGLTFTPVTGVEVWHPSVRVYEVRDGQKLLGRAYLDLHPRPNKAATGANVNTVRDGQAGSSLPETVLTASLPGGQTNDPGLMTFDEVRTLFHEFGHVVHRLNGGQQRWNRLGSTMLERDFTEAPSQMLEEWMWDPKTLATFARHHQTGAPIPADLVRQMRRASEFGQGLEVRGQMVLARAALSFHDRDPRGLETSEMWKEIHDRYMPVKYPEGAHREATFPHVGQVGYASAYYTYMWSLVIAKDMFSRFDGSDLTAPGVARRYLETVFAQGSAKPAATLVSEFLGRPFSFDAWERWLNQPVAGSR